MDKQGYGKTEELLDAIRDTAHDIIVTKKLAGIMKIGYGSLTNKTCKTTENAHLSPQETVALMEATGDARILRVMADMLGYSIIKTETTEAKDPVLAVLDCIKEQGEVSALVSEALADGKITAAERARARKEIAQAIKALEVLQQSLEEMGKPAAIKSSVA